MQGLTDQQAALLDYLKTQERCPSYDKIKGALGLKAKSGVSRLMHGLIKRGYVKKLDGTARSFVVVNPDVEAMKAALPDEIDLYRTIKAAPDKSHIGIARHIIKTHWPEAIKILEDK